VFEKVFFFTDSGIGNKIDDKTFKSRRKNRPNPFVNICLYLKNSSWYPVELEPEPHQNFYPGPEPHK
jgi:hypothetical protein